ncbi:MAG: serine hydrolase [Acidobacteriota bacterium]|nr:serine hydrolase [Acidobacteriota bacterium]
MSYVVEKAARMPFAEFVTKNILRPAGMKNTGILGIGKLSKKLAIGYTHGDLGWEKTLAGVSLTDGHLKKMPILPLSTPHGDAMLYSTLDDLYHWSLLMDGSSPEVAEIYAPGLGGYGYGWFFGQGFNRKRARHNGMLPGYVSDFVKFPDDKITIIIFSNLDRARLSGIVRDVTAITLGTPYDMHVRGKVVKLSAEQITNLEGNYKMADGRLLTVQNTPDFLTAKLKDFYTAGLIPLSPTEFYFPLADGKAIFTLNEQGKAIKVNTSVFQNLGKPLGRVLVETLETIIGKEQATTQPKKQFVIVLRFNPKYQDEKSWTEADNQAVARHFAKLQQLQKDGKLIFAGRTLNKESMGVVILEVETEAEARKIMDDDDAVKAGIMSAEVLPFQTALMK